MPARARIVISEELLSAVDELAGRRKRSQFMEDAVREKLARERLSSALRKTAGSIDPALYPEWSTPEKVSKWVRESRREDENRLKRKLARQSNDL